ncbi:hypothetical protein JXA12_03085 [Candidatus Woesearchaeota archaeon]|nr:hypothetical protein [Candidatus Woesearchaeota archaeon]
MASAFGGAIEFLGKLGVYDVVLPFLLVFTLMYAFLEKTRIFGVETYYAEGDTHREKGFKGSRKNLNAMMSFVVAFFVIASSQLVAVINQTLSHMVLLLVLVFCFILVAGSFQKQTDEGFFLEKPWKGIFMVIAFIAIALIFLNALGWLDVVWRFVTSVWSSEAVATIILIALIVGFMFWVTQDPVKRSAKKSED